MADVAISTPPPAIVCRDLCVQFDPAAPPVLRGINLQVPAGRIVSLVGPSGCGKTTLLRCIAGLQAPTSGAIHCLGSDRRGNLAYVFQEPALLPWRTAIENVRLPLQLLGGHRSAVQRQAAAEALTQMELKQDLDFTKLPSHMSGGMRMRVSLARAMVTNPSILLLDEPFAALDDMLRTRLCELVLRLHAQRPRTIVLVTHNISEAVLMSDEIAVVNQGQISGTVKVVFEGQRTSDLRRTEAFSMYYGRVFDLLREATR